MSKKAPAKKPAPKAKAVDFLLDVHTEPLPARFVAPALEQLKTNAEKLLAGRIAHGEVAVYGTLRHLVVAVSGVAAKGEDKTERFKGPKEQAWKTPDGAFTPAAEGFARKYGLSAADLKPQDGVLFAEVHSKGESAAVLLQTLIPDLLKSLQFPKFMTWEETGFKFGRPIRAIAALLGDKVIPVEIAGVKSGRAIYAHPTYTKAPVQLKDPAKHRKVLRDGLVIAEPSERRAYLLKQLEAAAKSAGGRADLDDALVDETVDMAEHPTPVVGSLRPEHMDLPEALLKMVMKKQLKFFPVIDASGRLLPAFVGVRDGLSTGNALVREGYQRVLEARFNDAAFFFGRDCAGTLESRLSLLPRVTYQKQLGSMGDKAARVEQIVRHLLLSLQDVDGQASIQAARLVYADLVTDVVKEFPELQGSMGGVYARRDGLAEKVAVAIEQFYFPVAAKTPIPATAEAAFVSLAGKLDSLAGCFSAGLIPTGSADPFALRRQALGVVRILLEKQISLDLMLALSRAVELQPALSAQAGDQKQIVTQLGEFIWGRAVSHFEEMGFPPDEIRAIRYGAFKDLLSAYKRLAALHNFRKNIAFEPLVAAFKRASNILKQSSGIANGVVIDRTKLIEQSELDLNDALVDIENSLDTLLGTEDSPSRHLAPDDYEQALMQLVGIKPHLDKFFENVMVMVDDQDLKRQRLAVLAKLVRAFKRVADLSEIQASAS